MPVSANPKKKDFYVYRFEIDGYPFYIGIGRDKRGTDRLRYVKSLLKPHNKTKLQRASLHVRVIARFKRKGIDPKYCPIRKHLSRAGALAEEKKIILRLVDRGYLLTNWQHNRHRHRDATRAVRAISTKFRTSNR